MANLIDNKITEHDLLEYLNNHSDFGFELKVLKILRDYDIKCEHGGHYEDPVTNKSREFDIRAKKVIDFCSIRMAVECKNIRENFPVLITCIPRHQHESYHQITMSYNSASDKVTNFVFSPHAPNTKILSIAGSHSIYNEGDSVGKSTVQVGRIVKDGKNKISCNDSELYEKWGQCLSSASDLIDRMNFDGGNEKEKTYSTVIPFVVIPDGRLWKVEFDEYGQRLNDPKQCNRVSCYTDKSYSTKYLFGVFCISHVEIVTVSGLIEFINDYLTETGFEKIFPKEGIAHAIRKNMGLGNKS